MTPRTGARCLVLAVLLAAGVACSSGSTSTPPSGQQPPASSRPGGSFSPGPTPTTSPGAGARPSTLRLAFAGDLNFDQQLASLLDDGDHRLTAALRPLFGAADLSMLNLETAITTRGAPEPKTYHFRAPVAALDLVASTGIDVVTMANNHAVDYGPEGFADTLAAKKESPIPIVGIGHDAHEAFRPAVFHRAGLSIAVLGSTEIDDLTLNKFPATETGPGVATNLDPARLLSAVSTAAARYDVVVVYLHWGLDYTTCPDGIQPTMAGRLSAAGADIVVGSHAHRVQGGGWLGDSYVDYGLGNFVWARNDGDNGVSGVLTLTVDVPAVVAREGSRGHAPVGSVVTRAAWTPLLIGDDGVPRPPATGTRNDLARRWVEARECTGLTASPP